MWFSRSEAASLEPFNPFGWNIQEPNVSVASRAWFLGGMGWRASAGASGSRFHSASCGAVWPMEFQLWLDGGPVRHWYFSKDVGYAFHRSIAQCIWLCFLWRDTTEFSCWLASVQGKSAKVEFKGNSMHYFALEHLRIWALHNHTLLIDAFGNGFENGLTRNIVSDWFSFLTGTFMVSFFHPEGLGMGFLLPLSRLYMYQWPWPNCHLWTRRTGLLSALAGRNQSTKVLCSHAVNYFSSTVNKNTEVTRHRSSLWTGCREATSAFSIHIP